MSQAAKVFIGELVDLIENIRCDKEQILDHDSFDIVLRAEWDKDAVINAHILIEEFADYLKQYQDNIEALVIFFSQLYRRRELSFDMICQVLEKLKTDKPKLAPLRVW